MIASAETREWLMISLRQCFGLVAVIYFSKLAFYIIMDCSTCTSSGRYIEFCIIMLLIKLFRIGPVTGPRLAVLDRGRRPRSNTADRGPVTGPIRNNLINEIFIN